MACRRLLIITTAFVLAVVTRPALAADDILLRQPNGSYAGVSPGGAGGYRTRPEGGTHSGVYDRRGNRVGTIKNDAGGARFYDNRGDRR